MTDMRSQPTFEGSTVPTDDEICDQVLSTRLYYVRGLGYGITAPSSWSSRAEIHSTCQTRLRRCRGSTAGWVASSRADWTHRPISAVSDPDDGSDGIDGANDPDAEANSRPIRAPSPVQALSSILHSHLVLHMSICDGSLMYFFKNSYNFNLI